MKPDGSEQVRLTDSPALDALPSYSPNGKLIVFVSDRTAKDNREFFQMTAAGGSQRRLFADPRAWDMSPDWGSSLPPGRCTIAGTINADSIVGTSGRDVLCGLGGNDRLSGRGAADRLEGGLGNDVLDGGSGNDALYGQAGNDRITGGAGIDTLDGDAGSDTLLARDGGRDLVSGGGGRDTALLDKVDRVTGVEVKPPPKKQ